MYTLAAAVAAAAALVCAQDWDYGRLSEFGPDAWEANFGECSEAFQEQSPINLAGTRFRDYALPNLRFPAQTLKKVRVVNEANHYIKVVLKGNAGVLQGGPLGDAKYRMKEYRFKSPSDHCVDGRRYPLEAQFIHENKQAAGDYATVGMFFTADDDDDDDAVDALNFLLLSPQANESKPALNHAPISFVSSTRAYWYYEGTQTSPPCEATKWIVLKTPQRISFQNLAAILFRHSRNNREPFALGTRTLIAHQEDDDDDDEHIDDDSSDDDDDDDDDRKRSVDDSDVNVKDKRFLGKIIGKIIDKISPGSGDMSGNPGEGAGMDSSGGMPGYPGSGGMDYPGEGSGKSKGDCSDSSASNSKKSKGDCSDSSSSSKKKKMKKKKMKDSSSSSSSSKKKKMKDSYSGSGFDMESGFGGESGLGGESGYPPMDTSSSSSESPKKKTKKREVHSDSDDDDDDDAANSDEGRIDENIIGNDPNTDGAGDEVGTDGEFDSSDLGDNQNSDEVGFEVLDKAGEDGDDDDDDDDDEQ